MGTEHIQDSSGVNCKDFRLAIFTEAEVVGDFPFQITSLWMSRQTGIKLKAGDPRPPIRGTGYAGLPTRS